MDATRLPAVVQYQGYGGGRGLAHEAVLWTLAGYAHLVIDTRGQGSGWSTGDMPDPVGSSPAQPGFLTRGILDPQEHRDQRERVFETLSYFDGVAFARRLRSSLSG